MNRPAPNTNRPSSPAPGEDVSLSPITPYGFGMLVGAAFGLIDILINAGVILAAPASALLRALGLAAFAGLLPLMALRKLAPTDK